MDHEDEFLNAFFTQVAQLCSDKAKETVVSESCYMYINVSTYKCSCTFLSEKNINLIQEKERESCKQMQMGPWGMLLLHLPQIAVVERSYADLGFLNTKNKGFLRKDVCI